MGQCSSGRAQAPTQLSSPPRDLVFRNMLCMAEIRSLSWMWKTWNCGRGEDRGVTETSGSTPLSPRHSMGQDLPLTTGLPASGSHLDSPPCSWTCLGPLPQGLPHTQVSLDGLTPRRPGQVLAEA